MQVYKFTPVEGHPRASGIINKFKSNDAVHRCSNRHRGVAKVEDLMINALDHPVLTVWRDMS